MAEMVHVLAVLFAAVTMPPAAAHVLERPGKARLNREQYAGGAADLLPRVHGRRRCG